MLGLCERGASFREGDNICGLLRVSDCANLWFSVDTKTKFGSDPGLGAPITQQRPMLASCAPHLGSSLCPRSIAPLRNPNVNTPLREY